MAEPDNEGHLQDEAEPQGLEAVDLAPAQQLQQFKNQNREKLLYDAPNHTHQNVSAFITKVAGKGTVKEVDEVAKELRNRLSKLDEGSHAMRVKWGLPVSDGQRCGQTPRSQFDPSAGIMPLSGHWADHFGATVCPVSAFNGSWTPTYKDPCSCRLREPFSMQVLYGACIGAEVSYSSRHASHP